MTARKILVVEDEGLIAADISARLEALGHTVTGTASTVAEAVEQAAGADLVLMDIRIDGPGDGIEAATIIRERYRLPVVFLTAHTDHPSLERAKLAGPYGYIVKPVAPAGLQTTIEMAIYKHQMERRLEESEAWLRAALGAAPDAVIITDARGHVRMVNPAAEALLGGTPAAVTEFLPSDPVALAILEDAPVPVSARVREAEVEGHAAPVKHAGTLIGAVLTLSEVSERRREQSRRRQQERGEITARLAAGVASEYTHLIATIRNQSERLLRQFADYAPVSQSLTEIQQAAAAADRVTRRLEEAAGGQPGHPEPLSLHGMLRRMSRLIQSMAGEQIKLALHFSTASGKVFADAARTEELLMRLVMHAVSAMPSGGELTIQTADVKDRAGDQVSFSVTHTGAEANVDAIDIAISPYLSPDDDRRLEVFFPQWQTQAPAAGAVPTLLLIEPHEGVRAQLHNFFEANGYNLLEAVDQQQGRALAELQHVDLMIGGTEEIAGVPRVEIAAPYTQRALLERVRAALDPPPDSPLTFSASAP